MLHDQNAQQLYKVLKRVRRYRPKGFLVEYFVEKIMPPTEVCSGLPFRKSLCEVATLENVMGFRAVLSKVLSLIRMNIPG